MSMSLKRVSLLLVVVMTITAVISPLFSNNEVNAATAVKSVQLNAKSKSIYAKSSFTLKATVSPSKATNKKITWSSSNKKIATVSSKGVVKGIKKGTVTITAKSHNAKKATCKVTVVTKKSTTKSYRGWNSWPHYCQDNFYIEYDILTGKVLACKPYQTERNPIVTVAQPKGIKLTKKSADGKTWYYKATWRMVAGVDLGYIGFSIPLTNYQYTYQVKGNGTIKCTSVKAV